ncbi:small glutamine-rich tetratricopeptide repeat-containing protein alpha [Chironomus tepperi]|uniref:small glutamine-rich tetratricopeptide repeat-containing protein alpha n=1 Tax=Chironomus tepperi TaxID=113505 RepID=UPI00391FAEB6
MSNIEKAFVRGFIKFLNKQITEKNSEAGESLEVAVQCLESCFELNQNDDASNPLNNVDLFDLFVNAYVNSNPESKKEAENLKNEGNRLMKEEKYNEALVSYGRAIALDASNPIYYCNRAAAYSRLGDYQKAVDDCNQALRYDPNYGKAYGRLGLAYSKMNNHQEAIDAYKNALRIEPDNQDYKNNMEVTQQRLEEQQTSGSGPAGLAAGMPAGFPGMGNIDFAAALNNPALVNMATRMMGDPSIQNMLGQLSGMNNVDALLETGRQLAMQMSSENPELFAQIRRQMEEQGGMEGGSGETEPNPNEEEKKP